MRREELVFTTGDGRRLCAQVTGPEDGDLIVVHMGTPGSRHIWDRHIEEGARRGLRHVCCSRPGYEGSDRRPGRCFADCAEDVATVADGIGAERFYVVGASTGANFALACAALLPERVVAAAALCGFAPRQAAGLDWTDGMGEFNVAEFEALEGGNASLERFLRDGLEGFARVDSASHLVAEMDGAFGEADLEALSGEFLEFQVDGCRRVAHDDIWGWFDDDHAIWGDWGFDPARIEVPLSLWHGGQDRFIPIAHGEWLASQIPGVRAHLLADEGHLSLAARRYGAVLDDLLAP